MPTYDYRCNACEHRFERGGARRSAQNNVNIRMRRDGHEALAPGIDLPWQAGGADPAHQLTERIRGRNCDDRWTVSCDLNGKQRRVLSGRQTHDLQPPRIGIDDGQRAAADRARRAENGEAFHPRKYR